LILQESIFLSPAFEASSQSNSIDQENMMDLQVASGEPTILSLKVAKKRRRSSDDNKVLNKGHWSAEENKKYHWFL
jgi:hypothetical protein